MKVFDQIDHQVEHMPCHAHRSATVTVGKLGAVVRVVKAGIH